MSAHSTVFTFHSIGTPPEQTPASEAALWVSTEGFESFVRECASDPSVRLTFDGGNLSDIRIVLPTLQNAGLTATFYLCSGLIDQTGFLERMDIAELTAAGMTIGSHGIANKRWIGLGQVDLMRESMDSKKTIEDLIGEKITDVSCPFGQHDERVITTLSQSGYRRIATGDGGTWNGSDRIIPRNTVLPGMNLASAKSSAQNCCSGFAGLWRNAKRRLRAA